ncbi:hypothetical protein K7W42_12960 [Deinococcus sp. HMF7604]|uniref:hypothetical protein n=1 Tax=Deinococcus betulae TaxID=2873312 RepID=UPI001CCB705F|nr:hypothetical protein [Deinococcus betulae]MBZ9751767.1 hypothetical protein [Deinococcus betulae]
MDQLEQLRAGLREVGRQEEALRVRRAELERAYAEQLPVALGAYRSGQRVQWQSPNGHAGTGTVEYIFVERERATLTDHDLRYSVRETGAPSGTDYLALSHVRDRVRPTDV